MDVTAKGLNLSLKLRFLKLRADAELSGQKPPSQLCGHRGIGKPPPCWGGGIGNLGSSVGLEAAGAVSLVPGEGEEEGATLAAAAANGRPRAANGRPPLRAEAPSPPAPGEQVQHPRTASARRI